MDYTQPPHKLKPRIEKSDIKDLAGLVLFLALFIGVPLISAHAIDSRNEARDAATKRACEEKAPYFELKSGRCVRIQYETKQACEIDKSNIPRPVDTSDGYYIKCLDDGTWTSDVASEDYHPMSNIPAITCRDVTSYDYNWNNDMLCTRPDGSQFYTSYNGARQYE